MKKKVNITLYGIKMIKGEWNEARKDKEKVYHIIKINL